MKALTICQPWAHLIVHGEKRIENRRWYTDHRGQLAIHTGKSKAWLGTAGDDEPPRDKLVYGAVIGVAELVDCVRVENLPPHLASRFAEGPWCWVLDKVRAVRPVSCRGERGLWEFIGHLDFILTVPAGEPLQAGDPLYIDEKGQARLFPGSRRNAYD